jgi:hypothetical protein
LNPRLFQGAVFIGGRKVLQAWPDLKAEGCSSASPSAEYERLLAIG